jgi:Leucine-rich repeat (LRR) protein
LLALALLGSASASFTCADSDNKTVCNALSNFFTATGGASWTTNTGWGGGSSYCTPWAGLTCSRGVVTALALNGSNLTGTVPDVFGNLTELQYLDLSDNAFSGTIPDFWSSFSRLTFLNLYNKG